jgi:hypothetical protein
MSKKVVRLGVADGSTTGCTMHDRPHEFEYKIGRWDAERSFTRPLGSAVAMLIALPCIASAQLFPFSPLLSVFLESCLLACLVVLCCFTPCDYTRCRFVRIFHFFFFCNLQFAKSRWFGFEPRPLSISTRHMYFYKQLGQFC